MHQQHPVHRAIMVVDVERFGDPARTNLHQLAVRDGLYKALMQAFRKSGMIWADCVNEDRGDGVLILVTPEVPKTRLVTSLPAALMVAVERHNAGCAVPERMRLRVALHAGEIYHDAHGVAGAAINHAFRLAEAPALKSALDVSPGVLALIVSGWLFDEVVRHDPAAVPGLYRQVQVAVKETATMGWIRVLQPGVSRSGASNAADLRRRNPATAVPEVAARRPTDGTVTGSVVNLLGSNSGAARDPVGSGPNRRPIPAQLPHDAAGFTGREPELAALESITLAEGSRAVIISAIDGVAGIGKTALAVHFAHRVAAAFPDGQLYVNLRGFDPDQPPLPPHDVLVRFLRALGTDPPQTPTDLDELAGVYRSLLSGRRVLIVLDNAATAKQIRPLLPGRAGCLALVTSRNRLSGVVARDGAQRLTLDVLPPAEAVALLARVIGSERVAAEPDAAYALARLCGWLPLALRISGDRAAAHRHFKLADLVDELTHEHDRLDILSADEETTQVRAVFSWSYRALPSEQARAFRLLSLHAGQDISAAAAATLIGATISETRQLLANLTGGHLLEETGRGRYQFHDLIRVYAAECAQISESESHRTAAIRRLLTWYLHTADAFSRIFNPNSRLVPLDPPEPACGPLDFTTPRLASDWAKAEFSNLISIAGQAAAIDDDPIGWQVAIALMPLFDLYRRMTDFLPVLHSALTTARRLGDRAAEARCLTCLGEAYVRADCPARTAEVCQQALVIFDEIGDLAGRWAAWHDIGLSLLELERFSEAMSCFQQALIAARQTANHRSEGLSLTGLGVVYQHLESYDAAIDLHSKALALLAETHNKWQQTWVLCNLAAAYRYQGSLGEAIDFYRQAQATSHEMGDWSGEGDTLISLGEAQRSRGQLDAALQSWRQALNIFDDFGDARASQIRTRIQELNMEESPS
jgi:tetratricopeptide (TPR) repeat protein